MKLWTAGGPRLASDEGQTKSHTLGKKDERSNHRHDKKMVSIQPKVTHSYQLTKKWSRWANQPRRSTIKKKKTINHQLTGKIQWTGQCEHTHWHAHVHTSSLQVNVTLTFLPILTLIHLRKRVARKPNENTTNGAMAMLSCWSTQKEQKVIGGEERESGGSRAHLLGTCPRNPGSREGGRLVSGWPPTVYTYTQQQPEMCHTTVEVWVRLPQSCCLSNLSSYKSHKKKTEQNWNFRVWFFPPC